MSFADTMRFGHDLSVALDTRKGKGAAVEFEEAVDMDAAIEAATGDLLVDLISLDAVASAVDEVLEDLFGPGEEDDVGNLPLRNLPREKQRQVHVNSELGGTLGGRKSPSQSSSESGARLIHQYTTKLLRCS